ncbi:Ca2+/Na+ antiporter [Paenibacillus sp. RC254]
MWFTFAIGAAFFFGLHGIFYQWTSQRSIDRNLLFVGVYVSSTILALIMNNVRKSNLELQGLARLINGYFFFYGQYVLIQRLCCW